MVRVCVRLCVGVCVLNTWLCVFVCGLLCDVVWLMCLRLFVFCGFDLCASCVFLVLCCMVRLLGVFCWCVLHVTHVFVCSVCELLCDGVCFVFASCSRWWWGVCCCLS